MGNKEKFLRKKILNGSVLREQVENAPEHAAVSLVKFSVFAALAGDMGKFFVLDVEDFADETACCTDFAGFEGVVSAFRADEIDIFAHFLASL
jgi:hypothetical protein